MTRDDTKGSSPRTHKTPVNSVKKFEFYLEDNGKSVKSLNRKVTQPNLYCRVITGNRREPFFLGLRSHQENTQVERTGNRVTYTGPKGIISIRTLEGLNA